MAKTQIGAVIGIEGAKEYNQAISNIVRVTKEMESEIKLVEAAFKNKYKTVKDVTNLEGKHKQLIDELKNKLKEQKEAQNAMNLERERAIQKAEDLRAKINLLSVSGEKEADALKKTKIEYEANNKHINDLNAKIIDMATAINETNTQIAEHERIIRELPSKYKLVTDAMKSATSEMGEMMASVGKKMTAAFTVPYVAGMTASIKAAKDWQASFTRVKKTNDEIVDSNGKVLYSYDQLEEELKAVGLVTASSLDDIGSTAEVLGQLGLATNVIPKATEYIIQLADSTNLAADEGASYVATVLNLMNHGLPITAEQVKNLGSAIVYLGNNYNTTEADIAHMAARIAPAAAQLNMTSADVLALSTALSSAQISAEGGGTAITQTLTNITKQLAAFRNEEESTLPRFAEIAGMSAEEFADAWETKPIEAFDKFITGLSKLDEEGEYTALIFDELGLAGVRQSLSLNALSITHDQLSKAIGDANEQYELGTALANEASKKYETLDAKITQFKNSLQILGDSFGRMFLPSLTKMVEGLTNFVVKLSQMPTWVKQAIVVFGGLIAALGPVVFIGGKILIGMAKLKAAATVLGTTVGAIVTTALTTIGVIAGVAAAITALVLIIKNWDTVKEFIINVASAIWEGIKSVLGAIWDGITTIGSNIWDVLSALGDSILSGLLHLLETMVAKLILFVLTTLPNLIGNVVNKVKDMGTNIKNTMTNLVSNAWSWGRDLIGNIISGITSKLSSLWNTISNVASTIWSYLHFSEPEKGPLKDFHTWMPDMMKGLAQGIYDNAYLVEDAIAGVAGTLGMGGTTNNYGGVVINLNVPQGANGQQIVDEIETELANRTMRRKAVFG